MQVWSRRNNKLEFERSFLLKFFQTGYDQGNRLQIITILRTKFGASFVGPGMLPNGIVGYCATKMGAQLPYQMVLFTGTAGNFTVKVLPLPGSDSI